MSQPADKQPIVSLIVAAGENGVIGTHGDLPWRLSSDLKKFRQLTLAKPIVMGRKTFQSIGRPLDGRDNIVVTRNSTFSATGVHVCSSIGAAMDQARKLAEQRGVNEIMIIGGAEIYQLALPLADRVYLTRVHASPEGDAFFPKLDPVEWREVSRQALPRGGNDDHDATLLVYERVTD